MIRCEAEVTDATAQDDWRRRRWPDRPHQCRRMSAIVIDERSYCRVHAGGVALEKWLAGTLREVEADDVKIHI